MITIFTEEEIREAIWQCGGLKSPGPDKFNFIFIKNSWGTLRQNIIDVVFFSEHGVLSDGL